MYWCLFVCAVLKAERVSNESLDKGYVFPDEDDNLTAYTGRTAQVMVPGGLLQNLCKFILKQVCAWFLELLLPGRLVARYAFPIIHEIKHE